VTLGSRDRFFLAKPIGKNKKKRKKKKKEKKKKKKNFYFFLLHLFSPQVPMSSSDSSPSTNPSGETVFWPHAFIQETKANILAGRITAWKIAVDSVTEYFRSTYQSPLQPRTKF